MGDDDPSRSIGELAALLRAGLPSGQAWSHVAAACAPETGWGRVMTEAAEAGRCGADVAAALRRAGLRCRSRPVRDAATSLAAAWQVAEQTGAPTASVLQRLAGSLRADADDRDARAGAMAGPRSTARVLTWLPVIGLGLGQLMGAEPLAVLVGTEVGRWSALAGAALAAVGAWWTRWLVRVAEAA